MAGVLVVRGEPAVLAVVQRRPRTTVTVSMDSRFVTLKQLPTFQVEHARFDALAADAPDHAMLRRLLVDRGFLRREARSYRRA